MEGEVQVNELIKKDITMKIISIIFAVILWFVALGNVNPITTMNISVPLKVLNSNMLAEKGIGIKGNNIPSDITITISGRRKQIRDVSSKDFEASIDLADINEVGVKEIPITLKKNKDGIRVKNTDKLVLRLEFEKISSKFFNVEVKTEGNIKEGYIIIGKSASPDVIALSGLESTINSVASIVVFVDITNLDRDLIVRKDCKVLDSNGEDISEFSGKYNVDVSLQVAKQVPVLPLLNNSSSDGSIVKASSVNPNKVYITGSFDLISQINELYTQAIDISNINDTTTLTVPIVLPEGVSLYNSPQEAQVSVTVEKAGTREITIDRSIISIKSNNNTSGYKIEITTPSVVAKLKGMVSVLNQIDPQSLAPVIDVTNMTEGTHTVPLNLTLPDGVSLVEDSFADVKITKVEDVNTGTAPAETGEQVQPAEQTPDQE